MSAANPPAVHYEVSYLGLSGKAPRTRYKERNGVAKYKTLPEAWEVAIDLPVECKARVVRVTTTEEELE